MKGLTTQIADDLQLTDDERAQVIASGKSRLIDNRVHWAKTYLKQAGLLKQPQRGYVSITSRGLDVLKAPPPAIDVVFLKQFKEFQDFLDRTKGTASIKSQESPPVDLPLSTTPEEQIVGASQTLTAALRDALLQRVLDGNPAFFEKVIVDLLLAMGYGGSAEDAGQQLGGSGDEGVDGMIREDRLGLDRIYLQAKRYKPGNAVGPAAIQAFVGALVGKGANKGVFITTSTFTDGAKKAAASSGAMRVILIDGSELTDLMIRFNVGVRTTQTIEVKRVDQDYFDGDDLE